MRLGFFWLLGAGFVNVGAEAAAEFSLATVLFGAIRKFLDGADVPAPLQDRPLRLAWI